MSTITTASTPSLRMQRLTQSSWYSAPSTSTSGWSSWTMSSGARRMGDVPGPVEILGGGLITPRASTLSKKDPLVLAKRDPSPDRRSRRGPWRRRGSLADHRRQRRRPPRSSRRGLFWRAEGGHFPIALKPRGILGAFNDKDHHGRVIDDLEQRTGINIELVKRIDDMSGFVVLPRRWVVERIFGWMERFRLLNREYERTVESSTANVFSAMSMVMGRRLA